jgi:hypothetical protein
LEEVHKFANLLLRFFLVIELTDTGNASAYLTHTQSTRIAVAGAL